MKFRQVPDMRNQELDDQLANMVDRALSDGEIEQIEMNDVEAEKLQNTVLRIQNAFGAETPDAAMAARIKTRLQMEWKDIWQTKTKRRPFYQRPQLVVPAALLVLLWVAMVVWANPAAEAMPGAAESFSPWLPVVGIVCILLIVILVLIDRRR